MMSYLNEQYLDDADDAANNTARDDAQTALFRHYLDDDGDKTLTLNDVTTRDFAQLAALRWTLNDEPLPFDAIADEEKLP
jgi:hypothetical protein